MSTARTNWRAAAVASALCLVLIVTIAILSATPSSDTVGRRPSTFFTDPSGARAIYLVLQQVLPSVEQWRRPLTTLTWRRASSSWLRNRLPGCYRVRRYRRVGRTSEPPNPRTEKACSLTTPSDGQSSGKN